jgi:glycerol-3-phosphate dehydrogenase
MTTEWAQTADDMLWRRSKLGLHLTPQEAEELAAFMSAQRTASPAPYIAGAHA